MQLIVCFDSGLATSPHHTLKEKWSRFDLKSRVTGGTKIQPGIPWIGENLSQIESNILQLLCIPGWILVPPVTQLFRSKTKIDSNVLQLLIFPGWILVPPVTQLFRSKWLHFCLSVSSKVLSGGFLLLHWIFFSIFRKIFHFRIVLLSPQPPGHRLTKQCDFPYLLATSGNSPLLFYFIPIPLLFPLFLLVCPTFILQICYVHACELRFWIFLTVGCFGGRFYLFLFVEGFILFFIKIVKDYNVSL